MPTIKKKIIFDYLIAGGGIAGLYTAYRLAKSYKTAKICILEASSRLGGRLHSIALGQKTVIEAGGARFNTYQHRILALINELGLDSHKIPINSDSLYIPSPNQKEYDPNLEKQFPTIDDIIQMLEKHIHKHKITDDELVKTNLLDLITEIYSPKYPTIGKYIVARYPYYSELHSLNALAGLALFTNEFAGKTKYFILAGGLEQLVTKIHKYLKSCKSRIQIYINKPLLNMSYSHINCTYTILASQEDELQARRIILALPRLALEKIKYLTSNHDKKEIKRLIGSVHPEPLYRIYAKYPLDKETNKSWFADMPKIVTNLPIKYIIPNDASKGIIMISYTDSRFARYWFNKLAVGNSTLEEELARQLKILFPDKTIPKPLWIKHYYWDMGAAYWKPGFLAKDIIPKIIQPLASEPLFICNENYSNHQAWVEGSLETADLVLEKLDEFNTLDIIDMLGDKSSNSNSECKSKRKRKSNGDRKSKSKDKDKTKKKTKKHLAQDGGSTRKNKWPKYTLEEVAKHNKKSDAWIVINKIVADITKWVPEHPGGAIIMKGVGKDATQLFNSIGHSASARKMLKKYQIGILTS
jgi:protoporphyrinogen oxidase/cytochrome b involved in lipid metabolism